MHDRGMATPAELAALQQLLKQTQPRFIGSAVDADGRPQTDELRFVAFDEEGFVFLVPAGRPIASALRHRRYMSCMGYVPEGAVTALAGFSGKVHELSESDLAERLRALPNWRMPADGGEVFAGFELFDGTGCVRRDGDETRFLVGKVQPQVNYYVTNACTGCGVCVAACPQLAIDMTKSPVMINQVTCIHCGTCYEKCPYHAVAKL